MMPKTTTLSIAALAAVAISGPCLAQGQSSVLPQVTTPDNVESRIGTLLFRDGVPTAEITDKVYDYLDFARVVALAQTGT
jgi:hypothetical protein